jgi:hypothetical protein
LYLRAKNSPIARRAVAPEASYGVKIFCNIEGTRYPARAQARNMKQMVKTIL